MWLGVKPAVCPVLVWIDPRQPSKDGEALDGVSTVVYRVSTEYSAAAGYYEFEDLGTLSRGLLIALYTLFL